MKMQGPPAYQDEGENNQGLKKENKQSQIDSGSTFGFEKSWLKSLFFAFNIITVLLFRINFAYNLLLQDHTTSQ